MTEAGKRVDIHVLKTDWDGADWDGADWDGPSSSDQPSLMVTAETHGGSPRYCVRSQVIVH